MTPTPHEVEALIQRAEALVDQIQPILAGQDAPIVGAALGELSAILIAGHHPGMRAEARKLLIEVMDGLIPVMVEQMIDEGRAPQWWREEPDGCAS